MAGNHGLRDATWSWMKIAKILCMICWLELTACHLLGANVHVITFHCTGNDQGLSILIHDEGLLKFVTQQNLMIGEMSKVSVSEWRRSAGHTKNAWCWQAKVHYRVRKVIRMGVSHNRRRNNGMTDAPQIVITKSLPRTKKLVRQSKELHFETIPPATWILHSILFHGTYRKLQWLRYQPRHPILSFEYKNQRIWFARSVYVHILIHKNKAKQSICQT